MGQPQQLQKIAEGREAEMFAWEDGTVLRLLRDEINPVTLDNEARALEEARSRGLPVPAVRGMLTINGRKGMLVERIDGIDLLTTLGRKPWRVFEGARICGELHALIHESQGADDLPALKERLGRQLASPLVPQDVALLAKERMRLLSEGESLCRGDFHPANVMMSPSGPVVIDWPNAARGAAEADVARTILLLRMGEPLTYTPLLRLLTKVGRSLFLWLYLRRYWRIRQLNMRLVRGWQLPVAVARLAEDIEVERPRLLRLIEKARRQAKG